MNEPRAFPTAEALAAAVAAETLLARVSPATVHRIPGELGAEEGAALYEPAVAAAPLDLVLLGIGPDGHTASLFPGNAALGATGLVAAVHGAPKPPPDRITLTLRALRDARRVLVLAAGTDKRDAIRRALAGEVPAGMVPHAEWLVTSSPRRPSHRPAEIEKEEARDPWRKRNSGSGSRSRGRWRTSRRSGPWRRPGKA